MPTPLKSVALVNAVFYKGQSVTSILATYGDKVTLNDAATLVFAEPAPGSKREAMVIPVANVRAMVVLDLELAAKAEEAKAKADKILADVKAANAKPARGTKLGVERFVKDELTGAIKSVIV